MSTNLYILEEGGEWPRWISETPDGPVVVRQDEGESLVAFASRVAREIASLKGLEHAVVACNERQDTAAAACRREVGSAVLSHMAKAGKGSLLFTESQRQSGGSRAALSALATELQGSWEGSGLSVSVRFGQPSRPPQESVPPPPPSAGR
jgi:hypothetical protein